MSGLLSRIGFPSQEEMEANKPAPPSAAPRAFSRGPQREPAAPHLDDEHHREYERVAAAVGFAPSGLEADRLRRFLAEVGIGIYNRAKVETYLTAQYGEPKRDERRGTPAATWVWKPLRSADSAASFNNDASIREMIWQVFHSANGSVAREQRPYTKPVPLPVLLTVEKIVAKFPDARFFVSDEYKAPPLLDPFLAVEFGGELFVVERWDEPSFRA